MEIQQRIRGTVLAQVYLMGGNLIRLGEGLQEIAKRPELAGAAPAPALTTTLEEPPAEVYAPVEAEPEPQTVLVPEVAAAEPKPLNRKPKKNHRR